MHEQGKQKTWCCLTVSLALSLAGIGLGQGTGRFYRPNDPPVMEHAPLIMDEVADCFVPAWKRTCLTSELTNPSEVIGSDVQSTHTLTVDCRLYPADCTDLIALRGHRFPEARAVDGQDRMYEQLSRPPKTYEVSLYKLPCDSNKALEPVSMQFTLDPNQGLPAQLKSLNWRMYGLVPETVRVVTLPFEGSGHAMEIAPDYRLHIDEAFSNSTQYRYHLSTLYTGKASPPRSHIVIKEDSPLPEYILTELSLLDEKGAPIVDTDCLSVIGWDDTTEGSGISGSVSTGGSSGSGGGMTGGSGGSGGGITGGSGGSGGGMTGGSGGSGGGMTGGSGGSGGGISGGSGGAIYGPVAPGVADTSKTVSLTTSSASHAYTERYLGKACVLSGVGTGRGWARVKSIQLRIAVNPYEVEIPYTLANIPLPSLTESTSEAAPVQ